MHVVKSLLVGLSIPALALLMGCQSQSDGQKTAAAQSVNSPALTCAKCQVTYVKVPTVQKNRVVAYTTRKSMECPDCRSAAENFFATGKLQHTCKTCGDNLEICESH
jgi:ABC-type Fe3+-hydroxamate transport system substrate-binding protein